METNTGIWLGLGVLGVLIVASLENDNTAKTDKTADQPIVEPKTEPKSEPKKVQL